MPFTHELALGAKIGEGFFSDVHEGTDNVHGKVAVKVLRQLPFESANQWLTRKEALLAEAQNLKAAEHENVVRVHALVRAEADDRLHLVTEFCDGGSLQSAHEHGPMAISDVRTILTDVCLGLECVHTRDMIHRDIKPGNILCSRNRFKVGDFGLVSNSLVLGYASAAGYLDHLAPEVHKSGLTSGQTDLWALGMTIYRLLHGHAFYQERFANIDIPQSVMNGRFALNFPWLPHIPNPWRKFIRKAMHDDTAQRFNTPFTMSQKAASLPIAPDWKCDYAADGTTWTRMKGGRQIEVIHEISSPRRQVWSAKSIGGTRTRTLDGVTTPVSGREAVNGLTAFFAASN
jgi:serine/threonine protein kinase